MGGRSLEFEAGLHPRIDPGSTFGPLAPRSTGTSLHSALAPSPPAASLLTRDRHHTTAFLLPSPRTTFLGRRTSPGLLVLSFVARKFMTAPAIPHAPPFHAFYLSVLRAPSTRCCQSARQPHAVLPPPQMRQCRFGSLCSHLPQSL